MYALERGYKEYVHVWSTYLCVFVNVIIFKISYSKVM